MKSYSVFVLLGLLGTGLHAQTTIQGSWTLYPPQAQSFQVSVQPPINADGSSVWSSKSTIPVQYSLQQSLGPVVFSSYSSTNSYSYLDFAPSNSFTIDQLTTLSAVYQFQSGNCQNGSLRWSINLQNGDHVYVYYGNVPAPFTDCTSSATSGSNSNPNDQSGLNILAANFQTDPRYEWSGNSGTYVDWATILANTTGSLVSSITLVLDGAENESPETPAQVFVTGYPMNATVGTSDGSTATFVPQSSAPVSVCATTKMATIQVSKLGSGGSYSVDESTDSTVPDQGTNFRTADCRYMYNLSGKSLGPGQYTIDVLINGTPVYQASPGTVFVLK